MVASDKFGLYETLGVLVPGVLLAYSVLVLFPEVNGIVATSNSAINAGAFAAVSVFAGQMVQALASFAEPLLFRLWGGKPSERALENGLGDRYFSSSSAARLREKLTAVLNRPDCRPQDLFLYAMRRANAAGASRVEAFNAQFAYHRSLLVLSACVLVGIILSRCFGVLSTAPKRIVVAAVAADVVAFTILMIRTRQRAFYYVREVLLTAEHSLDTESKK